VVCGRGEMGADGGVCGEGAQEEVRMLRERTLLHGGWPEEKREQAPAVPRWPSRAGKRWRATERAALTAGEFGGGEAGWDRSLRLRGAEKPPARTPALCVTGTSFAA
jgi:hypothetical protein